MHTTDPTTPELVSLRADLDQRLAAYAQAHPDVAAACVAVMRSQQPDPDAALVAQDHGLLDYNRWTGWALYPSGVQLADHVLAHRGE